MILSLVWVPGPSQSPRPQILSEDSDIQKYRIKPGPRARGAAWKVVRRGQGNVINRHSFHPTPAPYTEGPGGEAKASTRAKSPPLRTLAQKRLLKPRSEAKG